MLDSHELMTLVAGIFEGCIQRNFKIFAQHGPPLGLSVRAFNLAKQWVFAFRRILIHLCCLRFCDVAGIYPTYGFSLRMDEQHHLRRLFFIHSEECHQYFHHEIHGGVIVVQEYHPVPGGTLQSRLLGRNTDTFLTPRLFVLPLIEY